MDDLVNPSFFDYTGSSHNTMSSSLDLQGSGLESIIKQETYESSTWMPGCHDIAAGMDNGFQTTSYPTGLESLITNATAATSSSNHRDMIDPLEFILNQPKIENMLSEITSIKQEPDLPTSSFPTAALSLHNPINNMSETQSGSVARLNSTTSVTPDQVEVKKEEVFCLHLFCSCSLV